jgi:small subunit ribosomal protein S3
VGRKVHPVGYRLGKFRNWDSQWYADRDYTELVLEDVRIRDFVRKWLENPPGAQPRAGRRSYGAGISKIEIRRASNVVRVTIHTSRPGIVIGRGGSNRDALQRDLGKVTDRRIFVTVSEISNPELDAYLVARNVAEQIERRVSFKRAMRMSADRTMRAWAEGVKIMVSGRLGGREMSRSEFEIRGRVPLQTLRADIDYGQTVASTTYGAIGVKAWVHRGALGRSRREGPEGTEESGSRGSSG